MIYDLIIIGAGAAGLFAGSSLPFPVNGLIIEKKAAPGRKLLLSGSGQCNLTHSGSMKDFITHYGRNGTRIRSILYQYNNQSVIHFFENNGVSLFTREDGKVFPKSLKAQAILDALIKRCTENGLKFCYSSAVDHISYDSPVYTVYCENHQYQTKKLIISAGGCSYPLTGSDGSIFTVLKRMGINITLLSPALVPIYVHDYPYQALSGIAFQSATVTIRSASNASSGQRKNDSKNTDAVLMTHTGFSGPAVLNLSRYAHSGDIMLIDYYPVKTEEFINKELSKIITGNSRQLITVLTEFFNGDSADTAAELPRRFLEVICIRNQADPSLKASTISGAKLKSIIKLIKQDSFIIQKLGGYETAMVTSGGVSLSEIDTKTMESQKYQGLFFAGEVLDIDGDTGGYNLQFAFSSGYLAAQQIIPSSPKK